MISHLFTPCGAVPEPERGLGHSELVFPPPRLVRCRKFLLRCDRGTFPGRNGAGISTIQRVCWDRKNILRAQVPASAPYLVQGSLNTSLQVDEAHGGSRAATGAISLRCRKLEEIRVIPRKEFTTGNVQTQRAISLRCRKRGVFPRKEFTAEKVQTFAPIWTAAVSIIFSTRAIETSMTRFTPVGPPCCSGSPFR